MEKDFAMAESSRDPVVAEGMKTAAKALKVLARKGAGSVNRGDTQRTGAAVLPPEFEERDGTTGREQGGEEVRAGGAFRFRGQEGAKKIKILFTYGLFPRIMVKQTTGKGEAHIIPPRRAPWESEIV